MLRSILILVASLGGLLCKSVPGLASSPPPDPIPVRGTVWQEDGTVLENARVEIMPVPSNFEVQAALLAGEWPPERPTATTRSDAAGRFEIMAPHAGLWRLRLLAPGFLPLQAPTLPVVEAVELPPARLRWSRSARVVVLGEQGEPATGIGVYATSTQAAPQRETGDSPWRLLSRLGWSGEEGRVELPRARGESFELQLMAPGRLHRPEATLANDSSFDRGVAVIRAGTMASTISTTHTLTVQEIDGTPVPGAIISQVGPLWPLGRSAENGTLTILGEPAEALPLVVLAADGRARKLEPPPPLPVLPSSLGESARAAKTRVILDAPVRAVGRVLDAAGQAISGALVWPLNEPAAATLTDASGRYALRVPFPGRLRLEARAPGFQPLEQTTEVVVGESESWDFRLTRDTQPRGVGIRYFGQVRDLSEHSVAEAEVRLIAPDSLIPALVGRTDQEGSFEIHGPPMETVDISAHGRGFAPMRVRGIRVTHDASGVDLGTLILTPGAVLDGRVSDPEGKPLPGAEIWLVDMAAEIDPKLVPRVFERQPDAVTESLGHFQVADLEPGKRVDLWVDHRGFLGGSELGVEVPSKESLVVVLEPAGQVRGLVVSEDGEEVAEVEVTLLPLAPVSGTTESLETESLETESLKTESLKTESLEPVSIEPGSVEKGAGDFGPVPASVGAHFSGMSRTTSTDGEGNFGFQDAPPGELEISALAPGFLPSAPQRLMLLPRQEIADLQFVLVPGAVLEGRISAHEGQAVAEARVLIGGHSGLSDQEGRFEVGGIAPGPQRVQVVHPGYNLLTRELEIEVGVNRADLELTGGHRVSGFVVDEEGARVAGAVVELEPLDEGAFGGYRVPADDHGAFLMDRVADGRYRVSGSRAGYVTAEPKSTVEVAGDSLEDVEVGLQAGARIGGEILGLSFEELSEVEVEATSDRNTRRRGTVDFAGEYEISELSPGDWLVVAELPGGHRQARARVVIEPGVARVDRDLELDGGLTLSGLVLHGDEPLAAARVTLRGHELPIERAVTTDREGRFEIENLEASLYRTSVVHSELRLIHNEDLRIVDDRDVVIELATAELSGRVVDRVTSEAVSSVNVLLRQALPEGREGSAFGEPSGADGEFRFVNLPAGRFNLQARHNGYRPVEMAVEVAAGSSLADVQVVLEPTAGLELMARLPTGGPPDFLTVHGQENHGRTFAATRVPDAEGYAKFSSFPAGDWDLLISGTGGAAISLRATVPGDPLAVVLPAAGRLRVRVADLVESESYANLTVIGADGLPFQHLAWGGALEQAWPVAAGRATVEGVPAGVWTLRVEGPSGRVWAGVAATTGGPDVEVNVE